MPMEIKVERFVSKKHKNTKKQKERERERKNLLE
jgi:hypothetical protein